MSSLSHIVPIVRTIFLDIRYLIDSFINRFLGVSVFAGCIYCQPNMLFVGGAALADVSFVDVVI